jgi:antitoxin (DNA-binding transcriptional repressor) of toxin-antitoxin stability system
MTKTADVKDVAANFTQWLKEVAAGHEVVVTENDRPVARVLAAPAGFTGSQPRRELADLPSLPGKWTGEEVIKGETLADEMFDRS